MTVAKRYPAVMLATPCLPWDEQFRFDEDAFRSQVRALLVRGLNHLYLFGTAGEGYAVTERQFEQIVTVFAEEMAGPDRYPMVGLISLSLPEMIERAKTAYALGIRDFQFSLPSWGALSNEELDAFMHTLCGSFPDCRFMHYNLGRTKRILTPGEYFRFAEEIPNFVGAKYCTSDARMIGQLQSRPTPLQFFFSETGFPLASLIGECGWLISLANTNLERAKQYFAAAKNRDFEHVLGGFADFMGMLDGLFGIMGDDKIDGAYDKLLFRMIDPSFPLRLLPPYVSGTPEQSDQYRKFLTDRYPAWLESVAR